MKYHIRAHKGKVSATAEPQLWRAAGKDGGDSLITIIRGGFDYTAISYIQQAYQLPDRSFANLIGISDKTLMRIRKSHAKLSSMSGDRLYRLKKVWDLANAVMGTSGNALAWLRREQPGLGKQVPLDILDTEPGYEQVQTLLNRLEYGVLP